MAELYVIRHGECEFNAAGRINGQYDSELSQLGEVQADRLGHAMAELALSGRIILPSEGAIYSSDLSRASETGRRVTKIMGLEAPLELPVLRERHLGQVTGMTYVEAKAIIDEKYKIPTEFGITYVKAKKYGFETFKQATKRAGKFLHYVDLTHEEGETAWVFTHGDFALALIAARTGVPMEELIHRVHMKNTDVVRLGESGEYELLDLAA